jgi:hypothetical protein
LPDDGRPKLDIDTTRDSRDRLVALGCVHAAEQLAQMLTEAVRLGAALNPVPQVVKRVRRRLTRQEG